MRENLRHLFFLVGALCVVSLALHPLSHVEDEFSLTEDHESECQLPRLSHHGLEDLPVLLLHERNVGLVREGAARQLGVHHVRRGRQLSVGSLGALFGHPAEAFLLPLIHRLVRQVLQHGVKVLHHELILHELAHGPLEGLQRRRDGELGSWRINARSACFTACFTTFLLYCLPDALPD